MEVTNDNFAEILPQIIDNIQSSSFIAIDMEFMGFQCDDLTNRPSLFDSPADRYRKQRTSVQKFPPVQWGMALFTALDNDLHFKVNVYNIYLLKRTHERKVFSFSLPSLCFLGEHGFDFNKVINKGVTFANMNEINDIRSKLEEGIMNYDSFGDRFGGHLRSLLFHLTTKLKRLRKTQSSPSVTEQDSRFSPFTVDMSNSTFDPYSLRDDMQAENSKTPRLTRLQEAARLYYLHYNIHHVKMRVRGSELRIQPIKVNEARLRNEHVTLLNSTINEVAGVSQILHSIIDARLPVVGHNCLFDILYMYQYFFADLPEDYYKWKKAINAVFPVVIDTKILAEKNKNILSLHGVKNYSLATLVAYFQHPIHHRNPSCRIPMFSLANGTRTKYNDSSKSSYHNAAYDAKMTGETFVKLAQLIGDNMKRDKLKPGFEMSGSIRSLLYAIRPLANRIPVPLMGSPYINLVGDDPPSSRPKPIILESIGVAGPTISSFVSSDLSSINLPDLKREVDMLFGNWKCDLQLDDSGMRVLMATNTEHTYKRAYNYFTSHTSYKIVSECDTSIWSSIKYCIPFDRFISIPEMNAAWFYHVLLYTLEGPVWIYLCALALLIKVLSVITANGKELWKGKLWN